MTAQGSEDAAGQSYEVGDKPVKVAYQASQGDRISTFTHPTENQYQNGEISLISIISTFHNQTHGGSERQGRITTDIQTAPKGSVHRQLL